MTRVIHDLLTGEAQAQAILQARIEEALSGIKITLDRIYSQIHERK